MVWVKAAPHRNLAQAYCVDLYVSVDRKSSSVLIALNMVQVSYI